MDLLTPRRAANSRQVQGVLPCGCVGRAVATTEATCCGLYFRFRPRPGAITHRAARPCWMKRVLHTRTVLRLTFKLRAMTLSELPSAGQDDQDPNENVVGYDRCSQPLFDLLPLLGTHAQRSKSGTARRSLLTHGINLPQVTSYFWDNLGDRHAEAPVETSFWHTSQFRTLSFGERAPAKEASRTCHDETGISQRPHSTGFPCLGETMLMITNV